MSLRIAVVGRTADLTYKALGQIINNDEAEPVRVTVSHAIMSDHTDYIAIPASVGKESIRGMRIDQVIVVEDEYSQYPFSTNINLSVLVHELTEWCMMQSLVPDSYKVLHYVL
jgi:hypothetical protein